MSKKKLMEQLLGILEDRITEDHDEQPIGVMPEGLQREFSEYRHLRRKKLNEMERLANAAKRECEVISEDLDQQLEVLWEKIHDQMNIPRGPGYTIDSDTGVVSRKVPRDQ